MFLSVCKARLDLGFLVDGSGSIKAARFKGVKRFIQNVISRFHISPKHTRVGLVLYSNNPYKIFGFNKYTNKNAAMKATGRIPYPRRGTKTGRALAYTGRYLFRSSKRRRVLILLTDGRSYDRVSAPARKLRQAGIHIYAVGVGRNYNIKQLRSIAS
ncbi:predicted protein, partial [Nematostella vectensis]